MSNFRSHKLLALAAASVLAASASSKAVVLLFGTDASTQPTANPTITANPGSSVTLYVWEGASYSGGRVNTFSHTIQAAVAAGVQVSAQSYSWTTYFNPVNSSGAAITIPQPQLNTLAGASGSGANASAGNAAFGTNTPLVGNFSVTVGAESITGGGIKPVGVLTLNIPAGSATGSASLYFAVGAGRTGDSPTSATHQNFFGYTGSSLENASVSTAGVTSATFGQTLTNGVRTATADATISVVAAAQQNVAPSLSITAVGGSPTSIPGSNVSFTPTALTGTSYAFNSPGPNNGVTLVAVKFSGGVVPEGLTVPGGTNVSSTYLNYFNFNLSDTFTAVYQFAGTQSGNVTFSQGSGSSATTATISRIAVVPEPSALAIVGLLGIPALRRSRRA